MITINGHAVDNPVVTYQLPKYVVVTFDAEGNTYSTLETEYFGDIVVENTYGSQQFYPKAITSIRLENDRAEMTFQLTVGETEADALRSEIGDLTIRQQTDSEKLDADITEVSLAVAEVYEMLAGGAENG